jgi:hypothetical protein
MRKILRVFLYGLIGDVGLAGALGALFGYIVRTHAPEAPQL